MRTTGKRTWKRPVIKLTTVKNTKKKTNSGCSSCNKRKTNNK